MSLDSMKEIFDRMEQEGKPFWEIVLETDMEERQLTRSQSMAKMLLTWPADGGSAMWARTAIGPDGWPERSHPAF